MLGGEIFVPKIPSIRIVDLAKAMAPEMPVKFIGIRPGEKIHEIMCPTDDSHLIIEFKDHFVIRPSITFYSRPTDFTENALGEIGNPVDQGYGYSSDSNSVVLDIDAIRNYNEKD
jgi:UDP-N-acetylglucosamine 4,6-dehydratase